MSKTGTTRCALTHVDRFVKNRRVFAISDGGRIQITDIFESFRRDPYSNVRMRRRERCDGRKSSPKIDTNVAFAGRQPSLLSRVRRAASSRPTSRPWSSTRCGRRRRDQEGKPERRGGQRDQMRASESSGFHLFCRQSLDPAKTLTRPSPPLDFGWCRQAKTGVGFAHKSRD